MAEGINYVDSKAPFGSAAFSTISLSTTSLQIVPAVTYSPTGGTSYWWPGKRLRVLVFGTLTTAATPGNFTAEIRLATSDAGGTILATSTAEAMAANKTTVSFTLDSYVQCHAVQSGAAATGKLFAWGVFNTDPQGALFTTTAHNPIFLPATAPAETASLDLTVASGISIQFKRSGSTAETVTVQDYIFQALN